MSLPKYLFDQSFDPLPPPEPEKAPEPILPDVWFTVEELEEAKEMSRIQGTEEGRLQEKQSITHQLCKALESFQNHCAQLIQQQTQEATSYLPHILTISKTIAQKLAWPEQPSAHLERKIQAIYRDCQEHLTQPTDLILYVNPIFVAEMTEKFSSPHIQVEADASLMEIDCSFAWKDGGIRTRFETLKQEIDTIIDHAITHLDTQKKDHGQSDIPQERALPTDTPVSTEENVQTQKSMTSENTGLNPQSQPLTDISQPNLNNQGEDHE